jgi:hypothetical protein
MTWMPLGDLWGMNASSHPYGRTQITTGMFLQSDGITNTPTSPTDIIDGKWQFFANVFNRSESKMYLYINSTLVNTTALDVKPIIDDINNKLVNAVGGKESALKSIKGYFYKNGKDAQGNPIKVIKDDMESLHEIRTQLDTRINDKNPTQSYDKNLGILKSPANIFLYKSDVLGSSKGRKPHTIAYNTTPLLQISDLSP